MRYILLTITIFLAFPALDCSAKTYIFRLRNGNEITADSWSREGGALRLRYRLGEAVLRASSVASITEAEKETGIFQEKAPQTFRGNVEAQAAPVAEPPAVAVVSAGAGKAGREHFFGTGRKDGGERTDELEVFVDAYFSADDEDRAKMDAELDRNFSVFFDEGPDISHQDTSQEGGGY